MKILNQSQNVPITDVDNWTENPRNIKPADLLRLIGQIKELGVYKPLLCERIKGRLTVLGGNMRLRALREIGAATVWITEIEVADQAERVKISISDNDRAGYYDLDDLIAQLKDLNINPRLYKVDLKEPFDDLGKVLDSAVEPLDTDDNVPDNAPTRVKPGQIWRLGRHRLLCGDATLPDQVAELMNGKKADMVFTDPPYNVAYSGLGKTTTRTILNDDMSKENFVIFLTDSFKNYFENLKDAAGVYICHADNTKVEFINSIYAAGFRIWTPIMWIKTIASMGCNDYRQRHEPVFYCSKAGKTPAFYAGRDQTTTWQKDLTDKELLAFIKGVIAKEDTGGGSTTWRIARESNYKHPTQKPVALILIALKNSSRIGDLVLDFFGGSGSTLIACERLNRTCYTMELEPGFCDKILTRWETVTGKTAELAGEVQK